MQIGSIASTSVCSQFGNVFIPRDLDFTVREECGITGTVKPGRYPVSDRLRGKLRQLLRERGDAARLAHVTEHSLNKITKQQLSYFTTNERPTAIKLDHLDELASFFRLSIGELLGAAKPGELSGDEQRLVHAFRVLPEALKLHVLAVLDQLSVSVRLGNDRTTQVGSMLHPGRRRVPDAPATLPSSHDVRLGSDDDFTIEQIVDLLDKLRRDRAARQRHARDPETQPNRRPPHRPPAPPHPPKTDSE